MEYQTFEVRISNCLVLEWSVSYRNSYSCGPNHSKTKPLENRTKCGHFVLISNGFRQMATILFKMEQHWKIEHHWKTKQKATIGILNTVDIPAPTVPTEPPTLRFNYLGLLSTLFKLRTLPGEKTTVILSPGILIASRYLGRVIFARY